MSNEPQPPNVPPDTRIRSIKVHAGTLVLGGPEIAVAYEDGDFTFEVTPPALAAPMLDFSFTAYARDVSADLTSLTGLLGAPPIVEMAPLTVNVSGTYRHTPDPGELRRWSRTVSRTPWRRRSLASWRWLWRQTRAGKGWGMTVGNVRAEMRGLSTVVLTAQAEGLGAAIREGFEAGVPEHQRAMRERLLIARGNQAGKSWGYGDAE